MLSTHAVHAAESAENADIVVLAQAGGRTLWSLRDKTAGRQVDLACPTFPIEGKPVVAAFATAPATQFVRELPNGVREYALMGAVEKRPELTLNLVVRVSPRSPIVRFRYELAGPAGTRLTRTRARDEISYLRVDGSGFTDVTEVRLADFLELAHSYAPTEWRLTDGDFLAERALPGPLLVATQRDGSSVLLAYEHGAPAFDPYLEFRLGRDRSASLEAAKGNYLAGQEIGPEQPFRSIWFEVGLVRGGTEEAAAHFRAFVLQDMAEDPGTREPVICYNTWCYQERNRWWKGRPYLESMNPDRILKEIDVAHDMGIEVFVLDAGWFESTGDWRVSRQRFPEGLKAIREKLAGYGMQLGLWFDFGAGVTSEALRAHRSAAVELDGEERHWPVWETEDSYRMCVVSDYAEAFADRLIALNRELGVTYFKWDAIGQRECNSARHRHGTSSHRPSERLDSYAYQLPIVMTQIAEKIAAACPGAIIDFDVTEGGRAFGLGFLSAGRYFLINNGPYYHNFDVPHRNNLTYFKDPPPPAIIETENWNLFFFPGPARTWVCRLPLSFDRWIPSVLLLTHYYPDDPARYQMVNLASLALGQNGIWGDLLKVSPQGVSLIHRTLAAYREVRTDAARAIPRVTGQVSGSPEIHEKLAENGRGVVALFSPAAGTYDYVTRVKPAQPFWASEGASVSFLPDGRAHVRAKLESGGAVLIAFGARGGE